MIATVYNFLDRTVRYIAYAGSVAMVALVVITVYDVLTRYFGVSKVFNLNSTKLQESEFWAHGILFAFVMAYAYTRQSHVRIDLVRDAFGVRAKYVIEIVCILAFLFPFSLISAFYGYEYTVRSYVSNEISSSTIGLTNTWLLKSTLVVMFVTLTITGISHILKCIDGLRGKLTDPQSDAVLGGGH